MTTAWFHCFSGVAGDMSLGALVDAGADFDEVLALLGRLPIDDWSAEVEPVLRGGIAGTKVHVHAHDHTVVRTAAHIQDLVEQAGLPERVAHRAHTAFHVLAVAEGRLHRRPIDQVHFHEVGGIDAIVDVVGTCAALEVLDVDTVTCSPIAVGLGMVRAAHGIIPNPAPAVVELLRGVPTRGVDLPVELTTPTGAALMAGLAVGFGAMPAMTVTASGFGAGTRELDDRPNLTQVVLGDPVEAPVGDGQPVVLLEANVDDVTGEVLAHAVAELLGAGAHDAWVTPIVMKKGRPAHTVHALCDPALLSQVSRVLAAETGTLGVRGTRLERWPAARTTGEVVVDGHPVRVKVSPGRVKAEHDDAATVARSTGRPLREVLADAEARWAADGGVAPVADPGSDSSSTWATGARGAAATGHPSADLAGDHRPEDIAEPDLDGPGGSVTSIHAHDHLHDHDHDQGPGDGPGGG